MAETTKSLGDKFAFITFGSWQMSLQLPAEVKLASIEMPEQLAKASVTNLLALHYENSAKVFPI